MLPKALASLVLCAAALVAATVAGAGAAPDACQAKALSLSLKDEEAGVGNWVITVVLTNRSKHRCSIEGYASYRLLSPKRVPMATSVAHGANYFHAHPRGPHRVVLAPGRSAQAWLAWSAVPSGNEPLDRPCEPSSGYLRVTPPGSRRGLVVPFREMVCGHGGFSTTAFTASRARS